jgi:hypothetical protein
MLPGVLYADGLRGRSGFPTPAKGSLVRFRRAPRYLSVRRPPPARASGFILPRACRLLQSTAACDLPRGPTTSRRAECEAPPLGFLSLIAAPASGVHQCAGYPTPRYVPPSAFRTPSTVCSATCLAGLFHPAATSRVCPPGNCPSRGAVPGFPGPFMPSWRWTRKACGVTRASPSRPRLQGFAPRGECGGERNLFRVPSAPRPSWALPPPGFPSTHRGNDFAFPPPTAFVRSEPAPTGPRRLDGTGRG